MKIAITSTGNSLDSLLDERFGRCAWFFIFDAAKGSLEFIPNLYRKAGEDTGTSAVELLNERKVKMIISGEFGSKIKPLLDSLGIQMIILKNQPKTLREIVELIMKNKHLTK